MLHAWLNIHFCSLNRAKSIPCGNRNFHQEIITIWSTTNQKTTIPISKNAPPAIPTGITPEIPFTPQHDSKNDTSFATYDIALLFPLERGAIYSQTSYGSSRLDTQKWVCVLFAEVHKTDTQHLTAPDRIRAGKLAQKLTKNELFCFCVFVCMFSHTYLALENLPV